MKPILFNTDMVRAILDGRKTVTRRVVKAPVLKSVRDPDVVKLCDGAATFTWMGPDTIGGFEVKLPCRPGDILYVRETWQINPYGIGWTYFYKASPEQFDHAPDKWHPSIHMPYKAARIFLRVTDVRVERLCLISNKEAKNEGVCIGTEDRWGTEYVKMFPALWDSAIKPAGRALYGWEANPWVWVIGFERCEKPEGDGYGLQRAD